MPYIVNGPVNAGNIAERQWGQGPVLTFRGMTSCIAVIAISAKELVGIHLSLFTGGAGEEAVCTLDVIEQQVLPILQANTIGPIRIAGHINSWNIPPGSTWYAADVIVAYNRLLLIDHELQGFEQDGDYQAQLINGEIVVQYLG